ncbi:Glycosyl transferase group [Elusimicrobium minutum Pei191]|uniref:Glycosyl transferase group n=1 Tax=Elusimicrobium minutum (strain Pei191) TaxID=445932 RepID=B2KAN9_ELUMP|nr:glycosyltransferase [Elusimicrobium minutum]ACC97585.1 Glycosyl transferase group [Elusimicrobium minutum Pei191]
MRIIYVTTSTDAGGAEKAVFDLALTLSKENTVKVISLKPLGFFAQKLTLEGVETTSLNMGYFPSPAALFKLKKEIASFKPDVVHAVMYRAIQMCRMIKKDFKLFTTPHTNYRSKSKFLRIIDAALKIKDDLSLAESNSTADFLLVNQAYKKEKVKIILNTVSSAFFPDENARKELRKELNVEDKTVFINVARLAEEKGQVFLLNAFAKIYRKNPDTVLWLAGEGKKRKELENIADILKIKQNIVFWGFREDVEKLLNAADIFILPSLSESMSLALTEAISCGLPVIASDAGDNALICQHGKNGFICNTKDPVMLAAFMQELKDNKKLRKNFSSVSLKQAAELKKDYAKEHMQIYRS